MNKTSPFSLADKSIFLSGATGHLGEAMAFALAEAGGKILINSRSPDKCEDLVGRIRDRGYLAENAAFDLHNKDSINEFFKHLDGRPLHCIVNNAYAGGAGTIETTEPKEYTEAYEIAVVSAHNLIRAALPSLRLAVKGCGDASIINIASMYGLVSPDLRMYATANGSNPPFYGAAKAALLQWSRYAACEFGREGIRVNAISPGPFPSPNSQKNAAQLIERIIERVPLGRIGQPHEIQGALLLLASPASTFINGANICIDGGWTSW